jgi:hypothetical protein
MVGIASKLLEIDFATEEQQLNPSLVLEISQIPLIRFHPTISLNSEQRHWEWAERNILVNMKWQCFVPTLNDGAHWK